MSAQLATRRNIGRDARPRRDALAKTRLVHRELNPACEFNLELVVVYRMDPDPHGQAALMLCESLMLLLVEEGIIRKDQAADAIETVVEVKQEIAGTTESVVVSLTSIRLLKAVAQSVSAASSPDILRPQPIDL